MSAAGSRCLGSTHGGINWTRCCWRTSPVSLAPFTGDVDAELRRLDGMVLSGLEPRIRMRGVPIAAGVDQHDLVRPVELICLARRKAQRHVGFRRRCAALDAPLRRAPVRRVRENSDIMRTQTFGFCENIS